MKLSENDELSLGGQFMSDGDNGVVLNRTVYE